MAIYTKCWFYNRKKDILILCKGPMHWLNNAALSLEKNYAINFY